MPENLDPLQHLQLLLDHLPQRGWHLHNLHQCQEASAHRWEARLKAINPAPTVFATYGHGKGASPFEAISKAIEDGESRKGWRPQRVNLFKQARIAREETTTDDLLGGLDP